MLAFEFGTGAGAKLRIDWHVDHLLQMARRVARPLTLIVRGGSTVLPALRTAFDGVTYIDTAPFVKTQQRQRAHIDGAKLVWRSAPTARGASLDELLQANIAISSAHVLGQPLSPATIPARVNEPAPLLAV